MVASSMGAGSSQFARRQSVLVIDWHKRRLIVAGVELAPTDDSVIDRTICRTLEMAPRGVSILAAKSNFTSSTPLSLSRGV
jgi:hypothetical protein